MPNSPRFPGLSAAFGPLLFLAMFATPLQAAELRTGVGLSTGQADVRLEIQELNAIDFFLDFDLMAGDFTGTEFGMGVAYLRRLLHEDPVSFHVLGGISLQATGTDTQVGPANVRRTTSDFSFFGGVGAEYFFPGTRRMSLESNVGLGIHYLAERNGNVRNDGIRIQLRQLTGGLVKFRYYFAD